MVEKRGSERQNERMNWTNIRKRNKHYKPSDAIQILNYKLILIRTLQRRPIFSEIRNYGED